MSGIGNTPGERTMRTSSAPLNSGISQSRITTSGPDGANDVERGDAVARLVDVLDAAIDQEIADHLAHVLIVVDHQHAQRLDDLRDIFLR